MKILVTFAVEWEFRPWMRLRSFRRLAGNEHVFRSTIAGGQVTAILTGIGSATSVRSIRTCMDEVPDLFIASGLAGGLKPEHRPGEVLAAWAVRSEVAGEAVRSDERLLRAAEQCGAKAVKQFVCAQRVVRTVSGKSKLSACADAVDMESFAVMKEMTGLGVPSIAVRSIADSAEMDVPCDFERALDGCGRIRITQLLGQVAGNPREAWPLARFGVRSSRAANSLGRYLEGYTAYLAEHKEKMDFSVQQINP